MAIIIALVVGLSTCWRALIPKVGVRALSLRWRRFRLFARLCARCGSLLLLRLCHLSLGHQCVLKQSPNVILHKLLFLLELILIGVRSLDH